MFKFILFIRNNLKEKNMTRRFIKAVILFIFFLSKTSAQTVNIGGLWVKPGTKMSTVSDFNNKGDFFNDGNFFVYGNFNNEKTVTFIDNNSGKTFFIGEEEQIIEGTGNSVFKNVVFNNNTTQAPFRLATTISVDNEANFTKGIINARDYDGKIIFHTNAFHSNTSDLSFVDGKVKKLGKDLFQYPIGDNGFFRPSFYEVNEDKDNSAYTSEYFYQNLGSKLDGAKDDDIIAIDENEYWEVTQDKGTEKIILSLTLDNRTTPNTFFFNETLNPDTKLVILRWDEKALKWINEGGVLSDSSISQDPYSKLLTSQVTDYGLFAIGMTKKIEKPEDELIVFNAISPRGKNPTFHIKGIEKYPDNKVEIYNRWGVKVYEARSYNESDNVFKGYSEGRTTINENELLPPGTYFYIIKYKNNDQTVQKNGYLYLSSE